MDANRAKTATDTTVRKLPHFYLLGAGIVGGLTVIGLLTWGLVATHGTVTSVYKKSAVRVDQSVEVQLSQMFLNVPLDKITIKPHVDGTWKHTRSLGKKDVLYFEHSKPFQVDTKYHITFQDSTRFSGMPATIPNATFTTEAAPGVVSVSFDKNKPIAADGVFSVTLRDKNRGRRKLKLATEPQLATKLEVIDDKQFIWKAESLLPQGETVKVKIVDEVDSTVVVDQSIPVAAKPALSSRPAATDFGKDDKATLVFNKPIDQKSGDIQFSLPGKGVWTDAVTYQFTPGSVQPGTTYSYIIPKGLRTKEGGIATDAEEASFSTPGVVAVTTVTPQGKELGQAHQTIRITFNQPVDKKSAEAHVQLSHGTVTSTAWQGNTYTIEASNFGAQETVTIAVQPGIQPIFGLPSQALFSRSFTTEIPIKKLPVPMYYQQFAQSCEAADTRMALAYKGIGGLDDWGILQRFGYNPSSLDQATNTWADPQQQFVGDVKGDQGKGTGWGVYAEPVAQAIRSYGRSATVQYGVTKSFVAEQIHGGNPVILWGIWNESASQKSWNTPDGKQVSGPVPMHVRLVVGVKGKATAPIGFYIHDPITGPTYWTADYLIHNTQRAGAANQAVAVQ